MMSVILNGAAGVDPGRLAEAVPDPEVLARAKRRTFTAAYKQKIVARYEAAPHGERGALLRREGLYSSLIGKWQHQAAAGARRALSDARPGPKADPSARELARARREVERLEAELATSRRINDVQAKLCALLDDLSKGADTAGRPTT